MLQADDAMCAADICRSDFFIPRQMDRIYPNSTQHGRQSLIWREKIKNRGCQASVSSFL